MPRWLVASLLAILLSWAGFGATAQPLAGVCDVPAATQAEALPAALALPDTEGDVGDAPGDIAADQIEVIGGVQPLFMPVLFWKLQLLPADASAPSPALDLPRRPPRGALTA